jgi:hypothetical protein
MLGDRETSVYHHNVRIISPEMPDGEMGVVGMDRAGPHEYRVVFRAPPVNQPE